MDIIEELTSRDDKAACALADRIISESRGTAAWYPYLEDFASLLDHPKSLVRNRALRILAANARWDNENRFERFLTNFLAHVTDERPITARQCIQALAEVGRAKRQYIPAILSTLQNADVSKYKDSMRPLIEKDIAVTKQALQDL